MKLALDYKRLHLRFFFGTGFAVFVLTRIIKKHAPEEVEGIKAVGKRIKKLLKEHKRVNGPFTLMEIESDDTHIVIKV